MCSGRFSKPIILDYGKVLYEGMWKPHAIYWTNSALYIHMCSDEKIKFKCT